MNPDFDWCRKQVLKIVSSRPEVYESTVFDIMCSGGRSRPSWRERSRGRRAILVSEAVAYLVRTRRIETVPGTTTSTGMRTFREANVLDIIAAEL